MKLLFSSQSVELIEEMGQKLSQSGINCEIRYRPAGPDTEQQGAYRELWVKTDRELQWAATLLAMHCESGRN
ncbi:MAG TPA: hypothetical protein VL361_00655 [Candidatus Limnocylindrales bacterium]|jgi:hypothetical protein|nr:hypothetical protein [Candidatus Limnocylindrales bacterium]